MKKILILFGLMLSLHVPHALGHDFWAGARPQKAGAPLTVVLGWGHNFPEGEPIPEDRLARYAPLRLLGSTGELALRPGPETNLAVSEKSLTQGAYLVLAVQKPFFRSFTPDGVVFKPKHETPGATRCVRSAQYGKAVVNVGAALAAAHISSPVGHELEIIPLLNPGSIKAGQNFPVRVLLHGNPLPGARLEATFAGFSPDGSQAFSGSSDQDGQVNIIPLRPGTWLARVHYQRARSNDPAYDEESFNASLCFVIER
jgi:uncharacterized GH25 family protein